MEFNSPYLTEQIIAYIGNKRKLLPLIYKAIENAGISPAENIKFFINFFIKIFRCFFGERCCCPFCKVFGNGSLCE